jgi:circadian clock protein KaiB
MRTKKPARARQTPRTAESAPCEMRLFVAGKEANSILARSSLERICSDHLAGRCRVDVIDVLKDFQPALAETILVTPALVIRHGAARTVVFGNLTNIDRVLAALSIRSEPS